MASNGDITQVAEDVVLNLFDMVQVSLFLSNLSWSSPHQILALVTLGEGDHVSDAGGPGHDGHQSVQTQSNASVGRTTTGES